MSSQDSLAVIANRVSLAAAVLAAGAFLVAFLQALLEYSSSGAERHKCNECAIHIAKKMAYRRWSFRSWKWRYYYPELDIQVDKIFKQLTASIINESTIEGSFLGPLGQRPGYGFRSLTSKMVPKSGWLQYDIFTLMILKCFLTKLQRRTDSFDQIKEDTK